MAKQKQTTITDQEIKELRARNDVRFLEARAKLGVRWCCHPENRRQREAPPSILSIQRQLTIFGKDNGSSKKETPREGTH